MDHTFQLSMEQEFSIRSFADQVQHLSREEAQDFLVNLYRQMVMKETMYKHFLAQEWGLGVKPNFGG
ncbi:MAG TPA: NblA/ycf18 family protein [Stenomitos sp.]